jgi:hypothetical protein
MKNIKIFIATLLFISCSENIVEQNIEQQFERMDAEQEIKILIKYGFKNEIDTFQKTVTKDLVLDGTATMDFWFQPIEQLQIIEKLEEINFWSLPDTLQAHPDSVHFLVSPDPGLQSIRINYNNLDKTVYWFLINDYPDKFERLIKLKQTILEIVYNDPEYLNLPPIRGGYI